MEHLNVLQPPIRQAVSIRPAIHGGLTATGAAVDNTGDALASFLLGQVNTFSIDLQDEIAAASGHFGSSSG
jgi:hypothetical protein